MKIKTENEDLRDFTLSEFIKEQNLKSVNVNGEKFDILKIDGETIIVEKAKNRRAFWD